MVIGLAFEPEVLAILDAGPHEVDTRPKEF